MKKEEMKMSEYKLIAEERYDDGYFGDRQCDNCRVRYPSHYEREEEHHGSY